MFQIKQQQKKKKNCPILLNHEWIIFNPVFQKAESNFSNHTEPWLLPHL